MRWLLCLFLSLSLTTVTKARSTFDLQKFRDAMKELDKDVLAEHPKLAKKPIFFEKIVSELEESNKGVAESLYEGDMQLTNEQLASIMEKHRNSHRMKRQAITKLATAWGKDPIPYKLMNISDHVRETFHNALSHWEKRTCVRFSEDGPGVDRVTVYAMNGCSSSVGRVGGEQTMSLADSCKSLGTVIHEVEHLLGVFHTQSRGDRDDYVTVQTENILNGSEHNFDKYTDTSDNLGIPYEYGSLLHYSDTLFSSNGQSTLTAADATYQKSMGGHLPSFYDTALINTFYGCYDNCAGTRIKCENGGVQDVNDCTKCLCPDGYGGRYCNDDPDGCLIVLNATQKTNTYQLSVGLPGNTMKTDYDSCSIVIKSAPNTIARVRIEAIAGIVSASCVYAGLEVKTNKDARPRGIRHCSTDLPSPWYQSYGNRLSIQSWSLYGPFQAIISYDSIPDQSISGQASDQLITEQESTLVKSRPAFCSFFSSLCNSMVDQSTVSTNTFGK